MDKKASILITLIIVLVTTGVYLNILQDREKDYSKIPEKVESNRGFQRWITNLKNNDIDVGADDFIMKEENEVYNSMWMKVYSIDDPDKKELYESTFESVKDIKKVIFSPSEREFIDYRNISRDGYLPEEVRFFGQKEDKIIDSRAVSCKKEANCYFDRAYFLDNDVFVISEFSRNIDEDDVNVQICQTDEICTYTIKLHLVDLVKNSRLVYESKPFEIQLSELIPQL